MQTSALRHRHRQRQPTLSTRAQFKVYSIEQRTRGGLASRPRRRAAGSDRLVVGGGWGGRPHTHGRIPTAATVGPHCSHGRCGPPPSLPTTAKRGGGDRSARSRGIPATSNRRPRHLHLRDPKCGARPCGRGPPPLPLPPPPPLSPSPPGRLSPPSPPLPAARRRQPPDRPCGRAPVWAGCQCHPPHAVWPRPLT